MGHCLLFTLDATVTEHASSIFIHKYLPFIQINLLLFTIFSRNRGVNLMEYVMVIETRNIPVINEKIGARSWLHVAILFELVRFCLVYWI